MPSHKRKRHNKRKQNKKNKKQNKKNKKQQKYENKNKQLIPSIIKINGPSYKGNIFDATGVKYFGVLNGLSIAFYLDKNNMNTIPYDCTNLLNYYQIEKCVMKNPRPPYNVTTVNVRYAVRFFDINGNEKLAYSFETESKRNNWHRVLNKILATNKSNNNTNNNRNVLYNEYVLYNKQLLYVELINGNNNLFLYNQNTKNRKCILKINLRNNYNIDNESNETNETLFRYGIVLKQENTNNEIILLFKQNNKRHSLLTHIDYIIKNNEQKSDIDDIKPFVREIDSHKILIETLNIYEKWIKNNENNNLMNILNININYLQIL
eukprot:447672_1